MFTLLHEPYIVSLCNEKSIDVDNLFESDFECLCEQVKDFDKVGISPNEIFDECFEKNATDLRCFELVTVGVISQILCGLAENEELNQKEANMVSILPDNIGEKSMQIIESEIIQQRVSNLCYGIVFDTIDIMSLLGKKNIPLSDIFLSFLTSKYKGEDFSFYPKALTLLEIAELCKNREKLKTLHEQLLETSLFYGKKQGNLVRRKVGKKSR